MSILKNRGSRKGKGPKPMHSKKDQKKFEGEEVKSDYLEAAGLKDKSSEDKITSILETQGKPVPKKGYIDQTSMHSAVQRWNSSTPLMQYDPTGVGSKEDSGTSNIYTQGAADKGLKGAKKRKEAKAEKDAETAKKTGLTTEEVKKGKVLTDDQKAERRDKMKGVAYDIGRAMQAFAGWDVAEARGKKDDEKDKKDDEGTLTEKAGKSENVTEGKGDSNDGEKGVINIGGEKGNTGIVKFSEDQISPKSPAKNKKPKKGGKALVGHEVSTKAFKTKKDILPKYDIDYKSSTPVSKQTKYFKWLETNNLKDTHKNREDYNPSR